MSKRDSVPDPLETEMKRAIRLEWWTLGWMGSVVVVMYLAAGGSQAFRTALIEDVLSLIPAIAFLIAARIERRDASPRFPYGFHRVNSLAFLIAAVTLTGVGAFLLWESAHTLLTAERPAIAPVEVGGTRVWGGWVMIAALLYSVIPPFILGRMKEPVAERLSDKVLHTDALIQKADWMTGLAGVVGVAGIGFGLWWADAAAAGFIAFEIVRDGARSLTVATAELIDGAPRALASDKVACDAEAVRAWLAARFPEAEILLRETGRYIRADVVGARSPEAIDPSRVAIPGLEKQWRLESVSFTPRPYSDGSATSSVTPEFGAGK